MHVVTDKSHEISDPTRFCDALQLLAQRAVADLHMMRIYVQVPQELSAGIKAGLSAELHLPQYPDKTFKAMVATTSSAININARTLLVEL